MATAAPAAPSASPANGAAPAGNGSAAPAANSAASAGIPAAPPSDGRPSVQVNEVLPGVVADNNFDPARPQADQTESKSPAQRLADEAQKNPNAAEFDFAGDKFESKEKAEHSFKTLRGTHKALVARATASDTTARQAIESANAWKTYAEGLIAKANQPGKQQPVGGQQNPAAQRAGASAAAGAEGAETPKSIVESLDWQLINQLATEHGPTVAIYQAVEDATAKLQEMFEAKLGDIRKPMEQSAANQQILSEAEALWTGASEYTYDDGTPAYPELSDPAQLDAIGHFWTKMGLDRSIMMSPKGVYLTMLAYREYLRRTGQSSQPPPSDPSVTRQEAQVIAQGVGNAIRADQAAGAGHVVAGVQSAPPRAATNETVEQTLRRQIREASAPARPGLGFSE